MSKSADSAHHLRQARNNLARKKFRDEKIAGERTDQDISENSWTRMQELLGLKLETSLTLYERVISQKHPANKFVSN